MRRASVAPRDASDKSIAEASYVEITDTEKKSTEQEVSKPAVTSSKIEFLNGLRGVAAMSVVARHSAFINEIDTGGPAVDGFFVLSAYLLTHIFEKRARGLVRQQASKYRWGLALSDYVQRRFLRVYPLFAIVACVVALLPDDQKSLLFKIENPEDFSLFKVLVFSYDHRYLMFWTLPVEITYYAIIPLYTIATIKLKRHWWVLAVLLYALVFAVGAFVPRTSHQDMAPHLPTLLCGSLAASVHSKAAYIITKREFVWRRSHRFILRACELSALVLFVNACAPGFFLSWDFPNPVPHEQHKYPFTSFYLSVIIVCESLLPGAIASVLEWRVFCYAGQVSFSMYLLHSFPIYSHWLSHQHYDTRFVSTWCIVFALSPVSYNLIEAPCQRLAQRLSQWFQDLDADVSTHVS